MTTRDSALRVSAATLIGLFVLLLDVAGCARHDATSFARELAPDPGQRQDAQRVVPRPPYTMPSGQVTASGTGDSPVRAAVPGGPRIERRPGTYPLVRSVRRPDARGRTIDDAVVADHLLVAVQPQCTPEEVAAIAQRYGATIRKRLGRLPTYLFAVEPERLDSTRLALRGDAHVRHADYDRIVTVDQTPDDPFFGEQWGLDSAPDPVNGEVDIEALTGWDIRHDASTVIVAVIDTGVDMAHPDLAANIWTNPGEIPGNGIDDDGNGYIDDVHGWNFSANTASPDDDHFHGTHVAGIIGAAGQNGVGIAGVCWRVQIMPVKFLNQYGSGYESDGILALDYAVREGAHVINCSWGSSGTSPALDDAIDRCRQGGAVVVAAAGNNAANNDIVPFIPASCPGPHVIAVGALDPAGTLASFSNTGISSVHVAAPGMNILSTLPTTPTSQMVALGMTPSYGKLSGTSMAAPFVSGVLALLKAEQPSLSPDDLVARLKQRCPFSPVIADAIENGRRLSLHAALTSSWVPTPPDMGVIDVSLSKVSGDPVFIQAGDTVSVRVSVQNRGQTAAHALRVQLSCDAGDIDSPDTCDLGDLAPGGRVQTQPEFHLHVASTAASMSTIMLQMDITWDGGASHLDYPVLLLQPESVWPTHTKAASAFSAVVGWGQHPGGGIDTCTLTEAVDVYSMPSTMLARRADGSIVSWGGHDWQAAWPPADLPPVRKLATDYSLVAALLKDGTIYTWDSGTQPPRADATDVSDLAVGFAHVLAVCNDGRVMAWGDNVSGQCDVPHDLPPARAVRAHWRTSLAILRDGTVQTWGEDMLPSPEGVHDIIDAGLLYPSTVVALRADGSILSWGLGASGVTAKLAEWGVTHARRIATWGGVFALEDDTGALHVQDNYSSTIWSIPTITRPIVSMTVNMQNLAVALDDGSVVCIGDDHEGQLRPPRHQTDVVQIVPADGGGYLLHAGGSVSEFGSGSYGHLTATDQIAGAEDVASRWVAAFARSQGQVASFGMQVTNPTGEARVPPGLDGVVQMAAGYLSAAALRHDGSVVMWGHRIGRPPPGVRFQHIAVSYYFAAGITSSGQVVVWPDVWPGLPLPDDAVRIAVGFMHLTVLHRDGTVTSIGLGEPPVPLTDVVDIAAGEMYSQALTRDGRVVVWGSAMAPPDVMTIPTGMGPAIGIASGMRSAYAMLQEKIPATITFLGTDVPYDGHPAFPGARTDPPGLVVQHAFGGDAFAPTRPGDYTVTGTIDSWGYVGTQSTSFRIRGVSVILDSPASALVEGPFVVNIHCSAAVQDLDIDDLYCRNGRVTALVGADDAWQATVEPVTNGAVGLTVRDLACHDAHGAWNEASDELVRTAAFSGPVPTLHGAPAVDGELTMISIQWNETVVGFVPASSLVIVGGTLVSAAPAIDDPLVWRCQIMPSGPGTMQVSLPAGAASSVTGHPSVPRSVSVVVAPRRDVAGPVPTLHGGAPAVEGEQTMISIQWNETVVGFAPASSLVIVGGTLVSAAPAIDDPLVWQCQIIPSGTGTMQVSLPAGAASDASGNPSVAGSLSVWVAPRRDDAGPVPTLYSAPAVEGEQTMISIHWNETVLGFAPASTLVIVGGTLVSAAPAGDDPLVWQCQIMPSGTGTMQVSLPAGAASDASGNPSVPGSLSIWVAPRRKDPGPVASQDGGGSGCGAGSALGLFMMCVCLALMQVLRWRRTRGVGL